MIEISEVPPIPTTNRNINAKATIKNRINTAIIPFSADSSLLSSPKLLKKSKINSNEKVLENNFRMIYELNRIANAENNSFKET